jgi:hypothetical protein
MASLPIASQETRINNLLTDYADGVASLDTLLQQYDISYQQIAELVQLSDMLRQSLAEVTPSASFVNTLYKDLISSQQPGRAWWARVAVPRRVQSMSNRTKIAAGIGGLTLVYLTARSLSHLLSMRHQDETSSKLVA